MGGESSSGSSDSTVRKAEQRRAMQRTIAAAEAKERQRKQEEAMMRMAEQEDGVGLYARSRSGNIIRSSSGRGVTSRAGRQAQENIRAGFEGRPSRDMDKEFPMDTGGDDQPMEQVSGQPKLEPEKKTTGGPSRASRRLLAQGQMGAKTRQFY